MFAAAFRCWVVLIVFGASATWSSAQDTQDPSGSPLRSLLDSIRVKQSQLADKKTALRNATGDDRPDLEAEIRQREADLDALEKRFAMIATGVDREQFEASDAKFDLQGELQTLLEPLIQQLKSATEGPREIERLRQELAAATAQRKLAADAIFSLDRRLAEIPGAAGEKGALGTKLEGLREEWREIRKENDAAVRVTRHELDTRLSNQKSFFESTGEIAGDFFKQRGVSILLALGAFLGVFVVFRLVPRSVANVGSLRDRKRRSFYSRLLDVLWSAFTVVAAIGATLLVLYLENDWVLLLIVLIFVLGIGWASVRILPSLVEQVRLVLNLGGVREGDRILWDDVPYQVARLGLYTVLENPDLSGGVFRVPVRDLIGHNSRPTAIGERWFPTREGDWVILANGIRARVEMQTPEFVRLQLPGGGPQTISTAEFLANAPRNLSEGFRIEVVFGVDYQHQAICTTDVPARMLAGLQQRLSGIVPAETIQAIEVAFMNAGASSLDYEIQADFAGSAAREYEKIQFGIARILVDICNDEGWVIPFTQVTLHQAAS